MERNHEQLVSPDKAPVSEKYDITSRDLYDIGAYFYYSPERQDWFTHIGLITVSEQAIEALEVYKPAHVVAAGQTPEEFAAQREARHLEQKQSVRKLLRLIKDTDELSSVVTKLESMPDTPEHMLVGFLGQFRDFSKVFQLERTPKPVAINPRRYLS